MILHVTTTAAWNTALRAGFYQTGSLQDEGFIHCCLPRQLQGVLERYYSAIDHLLVLGIDEHKLTSPVVFELSPVVSELFPHVYGVINLDAVQTIEPPDR